MTLPFSHDAFLALFAAFNAAWWPVILVLWLATTWAAVRWMRQGTLSARWLFGLLSAHWLWSGIAYHWGYFRALNPAAAGFALAFVAQGGFLLALAVRRQDVVLARPGVWGIVGHGVLAYGLAYPLVGVAAGLRYPAMPVFGVPCPTTLITAGWLCAVDRVPRAALAVPIGWALIGASAAFLLGMRADLALVLAALALGARIAAPARA